MKKSVKVAILSLTTAFAGVAGYGIRNGAIDHHTDNQKETTVMLCTDAARSKFAIDLSEAKVDRKWFGETKWEFTDVLTGQKHELTQSQINDMSCENVKVPKRRTPRSGGPGGS